MKGKALKLIERITEIFVTKSWGRLFKIPEVHKVHKSTKDKCDYSKIKGSFSTKDIRAKVDSNKLRDGLCNDKPTED